MDAIHEGKQTFKVFESNTREDFLNYLKTAEKYNDLSEQSIHETSTSYTLKSDVKLHSFDLQKNIDSIDSIEDDHVIHCLSQTRLLEGSKTILSSKVGDIYIASAHGAAIHSPKEKTSPLSKILKRKTSQLNTGIQMIRQIVKTEDHIHEDSSMKCTKFHTEDIHPMELYEHSKIESIVEHPFTKHFLTDEVLRLKEKEVLEEKKRKLAADDKMFGNTQIYACDNTYWGSCCGFGTLNSGDITTNPSSWMYLYAAWYVFVYLFFILNLNIIIIYTFILGLVHKVQILFLQVSHIIIICNQIQL